MSKDTGLMIAVLAILVSLGIGLFGFQPMLADYRAARLGTSVRRVEIADLEGRRTELTALATQIKQLETQLGSSLDVALPAEAQFPELVVQLATMAERAGLTLASVQPTTLAASNGVPVTATLRGSYPDLVEFSQFVERNVRPTRIESVSIAKSGDVAQPNQLSITVVLVFATGRAAEGGL